MSADRAHALRGVPSFHPVYEAKWHLPETPDWYDRACGDAAPDWTDVLVDFRLPAERSRSLEVLGTDEVLAWPDRGDGWTLEGFAWTPPPRSEGERPCPISALRFTAPAGFRFAVVVNEYRPKNWTPPPVGSPPLATVQVGRFSFLLPTLRPVLMAARLPLEQDHGQPWQPEATAQERHRVAFGPWLADTPAAAGAPLPETAAAGPAPLAYSLETLRDAVRDPDTWFTVAGSAGVPGLGDDVAGPFRPIPAARVLLAWATAGYAGFTDEIRAWAAAGMDPAEVAGWRHLNHPEPAPPPAGPAVGPAVRVVMRPDDSGGGCGEDGQQVWDDASIRDWFSHLGGGHKRRQRAVSYRRSGLTARQGGIWDSLLTKETLSERTAKTLIDQFEEHAWTRDDVDEVRKFIEAVAWHTPHPTPGQRRLGQGLVTLTDIAAWATMPPRRACAYLAAGYTAPEATQMETSDHRPDAHTLAVMAGLRGTFTGPF